MGLAYGRRDVHRVRLPLDGDEPRFETAIRHAANCGLPLTIRFNSWSGNVRDISMTAPVAHFAVAVHYEPAELPSTQAALSVFGHIAAMAG